MEKEIWRYNDNQVIQIIYERDDGILISRTKGISTKKQVMKQLDFFNEYSIKKDKKILLVFDNINLEKIDVDARNYCTKYTDKDSPFKKCATIGDNFFMRSFINLYATIKTETVQMMAFKTLNQAIKWLKS